MVLQMNEQSKIEDPRNYGPDVVGELRSLLAMGRSVQRDPRRQHFYELYDSQHTFYIHISPVSGDVTLLARWLGGSKHNGLDTTTPVGTPDEILASLCT